METLGSYLDFDWISHRSREYIGRLCAIHFDTLGSFTSVKEQKAITLFSFLAQYSEVEHYYGESSVEAFIHPGENVSLGLLRKGAFMRELELLYLEKIERPNESVEIFESHIENVESLLRGWHYECFMRTLVPGWSEMTGITLSLPETS